MGLKKILAVAMTAGMIISFMPATAMADGGGWRGNDKDGWSYYTSDTEYVKNDWKKISGKWYYFDEYDGSMVTGELLLGDVWYYFKDSGEMLTGWYSVMVDGEKRWIYANSDGSLVYDDWLQKGDKFYYFDGPFMVSNVVGFVIEDLEYDFYPSGECANPNEGRPIAVG